MLTGSEGYLWGLILLIMIKELRIDNLILYGAHGPVLVIEVKKTGKVRVEFLSAQSIEHGYYRMTMNISQFDPIPLTPEWLGRCGFEDHGTYWERTASPSFVLLKDDKGLYIGNPVRSYVHAVHHLQNLVFALTEGEELQIKLP
jgi:hypothetical protein